MNLQSWESRKVGFTSCRRYRWDVWVLRAATARAERSCTARIVAWLQHLQKSSQNLLALSNGEVIGHSILQVRGLCERGYLPKIAGMSVAKVSFSQVFRQLTRRLLSTLFPKVTSEVLRGRFN